MCVKSNLNDSHLLHHLTFTATRGFWKRKLRLKGWGTCLRAYRCEAPQVAFKLWKGTHYTLFFMLHTFSATYSELLCCVVIDVKHIARMCKTLVFPLPFNFLKITVNKWSAKTKDRLVQKKTLHFNFSNAFGSLHFMIMWHLIIKYQIKRF